MSLHPLCLFLLAGMVTAHAAVFHVSPRYGNDAWSGTQAAATGDDGPFASLPRAQSAARAARAAAPDATVEIVLHDGLYLLDEPFTLDEADSGRAGAATVYRAAPGARPRLSGGRLLHGWTETTHNGRRAWTIALPDVGDATAAPRQLFVNGRRCPRPRLPKQGWHTFTGSPDIAADTPWGRGQTRAYYAPGTIDPAWRNRDDVEVVALHFWIESRLPIRDVDAGQHLVTFAHPSTFRLSETGKTPGPPFARYYVDNVLEALDTPGEFYFDRATKVLTYLPLPGESIDTAEAVVPRLGRVAWLHGARHVQLIGLAFEHMAYRLPDGVAGSRQAAVDVPAAVSLDGASDCRVVGCRIAHVAGYGLELERGACDNALLSNRLEDLGAGGIRAGHGTTATVMLDNVITDGGKVFHSGNGILILRSSFNLVAHNEISNLYQTGISIGWNWGYTRSRAHDNRVEYNHIHDLGCGLLSDIGGIYTLGQSPGTRLAHNLIHDVTCFDYGGWGLYNDQASTAVVMENNLVYRAQTGGYHLHYGRENIVRNNIFALSSEGAIIRTRAEQHRSFTFERNIVVTSDGKPVAGKDFLPANAAFDYNLYHDVNGRPLSFAGMDWSAWRDLGFDANSQINDPQFVDLRGLDFRLQPHSAALSLGFVPFDWKLAGPRERGSVMSLQ